MIVGAITCDGVQVGTVEFSFGQDDKPPGAPLGNLADLDIGLAGDAVIGAVGKDVGVGYGSGSGRSVGPSSYGAGAGSGSGPDPRNKVPLIRSEAIKHGIDPDTAVRVARSEGLTGFLGDHGTSGGAFQLHVHGGLGDTFRKETGLDPLDPKNEDATIAWTMGYLEKHPDWSPWHGAAYVGVRGSQGIGLDREMLSAREQSIASHSAATTSSGMAGDAPAHILDQARQAALLGGPGAVSAYMERAGYPRNGNWCGEFAAAVVKTAGGQVPMHPEVASNWRRWGLEVAEPSPGYVAVRRGTPTGSTGSHVTFVESSDPQRGTFVGLGGNQGRPEVTLSARDYQFYAPRPNATASVP